MTDNIKKVNAKPFDRSFDEQLNVVEELYGSQLQLNFTRTDVYNIIDSLKNVYDEKIVQRVETILLQQMRKYQYLF